jgi:hypothetical protein
MSTRSPIYVVKGGHTLGVLTPAGGLDVLQGDVWTGGHDWKNGPTFLGTDWRMATVGDFHRFRVLPPPPLRHSTPTGSPS